MRKYGITCIGVKDNYRLYYDDKHNEYLLMTPNFRFTRMFGHCNNSEVSEWAYKIRENHKRKKELENQFNILVQNIIEAESEEE